MMKYVNRLEDILIGLLLVGVTLLVFVEVIMRFGFNTGIHWAQEATLLMSAWMVLLGAAWAVREKSHICVEALLEKLSANARKWMVLFSIAVALVYCGLFISSSWTYVSKLHFIAIELEDIPIPKWTVVSGLLIGFSLLVLRLLELGWQVWKGEANGFHEHRESLLHDEGCDNDDSNGEKA
ncbi:MAG: TRAP transporter small permease [Oceanobacter sp.]